MILEIRSSDRAKLPAKETAAFKGFLQKIENRRVVGYLRYGDIDQRKKYMSKLAAELKAYRKSGNAEQLYNIAVYAFLESYAPENKKFYFDASADSVTRAKFGGR